MADATDMSQPYEAVGGDDVMRSIKTSRKYFKSQNDDGMRRVVITSFRYDFYIVESLISRLVNHGIDVVVDTVNDGIKNNSYSDLRNDMPSTDRYIYVLSDQSIANSDFIQD